MVDAGKTKHPTFPPARYQFNDVLTWLQCILCLMVSSSFRIPSVAESASVLYLVVCSLRVMVITIVKVVFGSFLKRSRIWTSQYASSLHQLEFGSLTSWMKVKAGQVFLLSEYFFIVKNLYYHPVVFQSIFVSLCCIYLLVHIKEIDHLLETGFLCILSFVCHKTHNKLPNIHSSGGSSPTLCKLFVLYRA